MGAPRPASDLRDAGLAGVALGGGPHGAEGDVAWIRRRSARATGALLVVAAAAAVAVLLLARESSLVLLPAAFILGWLNLVGL